MRLKVDLSASPSQKGHGQTSGVFQEGEETIVPRQKRPSYLSGGRYIPAGEKSGSNLPAKPLLSRLSISKIKPLLPCHLQDSGLSINIQFELPHLGLQQAVVR